MVFLKAKARSTNCPFNIKIYTFRSQCINKKAVKCSHIYGNSMLPNCLQGTISEYLTVLFIERWCLIIFK